MHAVVENEHHGDYGMTMRVYQRRQILTLFVITVSVIGALNVAAQNCEVNFPGTALRNFSTTCGGSTVANLELGKTTHMGNGDVFTFNAPAVINVTGNLKVDAQGNAKIVIPAGVTVNVSGNFQLDPKSAGCSSSNLCTFEIEVNGTLHVSSNLDNSLVTIIWTGTGNVTVDDNFKNSSNGCMACGPGGCPNFDVNPSKCDDDGSGCSDSDFCATILNGCSNDTTNPLITNCPANRTVIMTGPGCTQSVTWNAPIVTDNCTLASVVESHSPGFNFPKGTTTVTYTATDAAGNIATCSFNVTVVDNIAPTLSGCSANRTVNANASCQAVVTWNPPTYSDNCLGTTLSSSRLSGSIFDKGTTVVTYTATDAAGNIATCSFNVTVVDNMAPTISGCPSNITASANANCQAFVNWSAPTVFDNCGGATLTSTKNPGSAFNVGTTLVTYTASTASGESATCSFEVTVVDDTPPLITTNGIVRATVGSDCSTSVNWPAPHIQDCNEVQVMSSHQPGDDFEFGSTNVTYTLTDALGNTSTHTFEVRVENQTPPVITNCPPDINLEADQFGLAIANWTEPTASVACGELSLTGSHTPGQAFQIGTTQVVYTASDDLENKRQCSFTVIVSPAKIDIEIKNVVTPDGNGINDYLEIENIEKYTENRLVIVDRWGSVIFKGNGYDNNKVVWKGNNLSGGAVPTGTYFYNMTVWYGPQSIQRTGFIELLR
jgi:gliding motility-associated-like protein